LPDPSNPNSILTTNSDLQRAADAFGRKKSFENDMVNHGIIEDI
jgi:hypothetical protein